MNSPKHPPRVWVDEDGKYCWVLKPQLGDPIPYVPESSLLEAQARVRELEQALERIATDSSPPWDLTDLRSLARKALAAKGKI